MKDYKNKIWVCKATDITDFLDFLKQIFNIHLLWHMFQMYQYVYAKYMHWSSGLLNL